MGMDLEGKGGYYRWTGGAWHDVLTLATHFGVSPTRARTSPAESASSIPMGTELGANPLRRLRYRLRKQGKTPRQIAAAIRRERRARHGLYCVNEGQEVCAADAQNLAAALGLTLAAADDLFTRSGARTRKRTTLSREAIDLLRSCCAGPARQPMADFIAFCAAGRFAIR